MKVITSKSKLACQQIHYGVAVWALDYSPCAPGWMIQTPPPPHDSHGEQVAGFGVASGLCISRVRWPKATQHTDLLHVLRT